MALEDADARSKQKQQGRVGEAMHSAVGVGWQPLLLFVPRLPTHLSCFPGPEVLPLWITRIASATPQDEKNGISDSTVDSAGMFTACGVAQCGGEVAPWSTARCVFPAYFSRATHADEWGRCNDSTRGRKQSRW